MKIKITYEEFYEAILLYVKAIEKLRISDSFDNDCEFWGPFFIPSTCFQTKKGSRNNLKPF